MVHFDVIIVCCEQSQLIKKSTFSEICIAHICHSMAFAKLHIENDTNHWTHVLTKSHHAMRIDRLQQDEMQVRTFLHYSQTK